MKTLVMYGEAFGAEEMIPVTAEKGHLVTSFGLSLMKPVYDLMDQLIEGGAVNGQKFSVDPPPPGSGCTYETSAEAGVHEQSAVWQDAGGHQLQQAAHLFLGPLLHRRRDAADHGERGVLR